MDVGRDDRKEQVGESWIPKTPFKPVLPKPQIIYTDRQGYQMDQDQLNRLKSTEFRSNFCQGAATFETWTICPDSSKSNWEIVSQTKKGTTEEPLPEVLSGTKLKFASLLTLQDQASAALTRSATTSRNGDCQLESNGLWSDNFRHNSRRETADSVSCKTTNQMGPVTPEKTPRAESKQFARMQQSCTNGTAHQEINDQGRENNMAVVNMNRLLTDSELQELAKDSFGAVSTEVAENGNDAIPCETPQQKPRRRKHRPKVKTERKPRIRRPATPKPAPSTENQTVKRNYVRKKPLDKIPIIPSKESKETSTPTECKETSTPATEFIENSTYKRKYVRNKLLNEEPKLVVEPTGEPTSAQAPKPPNHSCRRSLNFDSEGYTGYVSSECNPNLDGGSQLKAKDVSGGYKSKSTVNFGSGIEVMVESTCDLSRSIDQMRKKYNSLPKRRAPGEPLVAMNHPPKRKWNDECQKNHEIGGDQVTTHDAHQNTSEIILYTSVQSPPRKINASNCENRRIMAKEVRINRTEWEICNYSNQQDTCSTNQSGIYYNVISAYETRMGQNSTISCMTSSTDIAGQETTGVLGSTLQSSSCVLTQVEDSKRKRLRIPTRLRDVEPLNKILREESHPNSAVRQPPISYNVHQAADLDISHACDKTLAAEMHKQPRTEKIIKESVPLVNCESSSTDEQSHGKITLNNRYRYSTMLLDVWMSPLVQQLQQLDINRETSGIAYKEENAFVPYSAKNEQQNGLVLYSRDGTVIPFQPIKKRPPRPKVDLDQETSRVWKLLLENINSQGIDGTDEEKANWWKQEREVFSGRANSFIARMHLVQGDRRFTPWKGSVVDSVVGVFLTQNVSDHLSSSAFMSLAAHFPLKSTSHEAMRDSVIEKPMVCIPEFEDAINDMTNQSICNQSIMILHDSEPDEERESNESSVSSTAIVHSTRDAESYYDSEENRSTTDATKTTDACYVEGKGTMPNDAVSSQNSVVSLQNSADSPSAQTSDRNESLSDKTVTDQIDQYKHNCLKSSDTFTELMMKAGRNELHEIPSHGNGTSLSTQNSYEFSKTQNVPNGKKRSINISNSSLEVFTTQHPTSESKVVAEETKYPDISKNNARSLVKEQSSFTSVSANQTDENNLNHSTHVASGYSAGNDPPWSNIQEGMQLTIPCQVGIAKDHNIVEKPETQAENNELQQNMILPNLSGKHQDIEESSKALNILEKESQKKTESDLTQHGLQEIRELNAKRKAKGRRVGGEIRDDVDWDALKKEAESNARKREKTPNTMDSLDWEAVRCADVDKIANAIKERGMNNVLAARIQDFLNRLVREHGSIDLEWLRDVPPDKAKEYLLTIRGLGLKSVECVRLLTLHHHAFPVDTNVGRIAVRLGWVPLQPLPESLQLHLLELYPVLETIQQYLWPRLCKLDQKTLYELHYQMITFGKVFCTKNKPSCNACPMRGECRHFASAFASARLALPGLEEKGIVSATENRTNEPNPAVIVDHLQLPLTQAAGKSEENHQLESKQLSEVRYEVKKCEPIVEEPSSPEPESTQVTELDIEDTICEEPHGIPTIKLNIEQFTQNLQTYMQNNMELQEGEMSKALVALTEEAASIPTTKLKNVSRLRTEHHVYELPDSHPLLQGLDRREPDDPCSYLLAIWTPGETANSIQPPESTCNLQEHGKLCDEKTCFSCNGIREANSQIVRGTLLIPCRTAMRGSFPLNGTYFQVNEVFADHDSSLNPIDVPRSWIWNLPRRTVYFGTSIPTIFKGLSTEGIQHCFWRGYVCVRGFDKKTRAPRPLLARLHFPASKLNITKRYDGNE